MVFGAKALASEGAMTVGTLRVALAGVVFDVNCPLPVAVKPPAGMVLIRLPGVVEVTSIVTVQEPFVTPTCGGTVPPLKEMVVPPPTAVRVPPQVFASTFNGLVRVMPGWTPTKLSVHVALVSWNKFELKIVMLSWDVSPDAMLIGLKLLLNPA